MFDETAGDAETDSMPNVVTQDVRAPYGEWLSERTCILEDAPARLVLWVRAPGRSSSYWLRVASLATLDVAVLAWMAVRWAPGGLVVFVPFGTFVAVTGLWFFFGHELITAEPYRLTIQRRLWGLPAWVRRVVGPDHLTSLDASPWYASDVTYWNGWARMGHGAGTIVVREWAGRFGEMLATDEAEDIIDRLQPVLFSGPPPEQEETPGGYFWSRG